MKLLILLLTLHSVSLTWTPPTTGAPPVMYNIYKNQAGCLASFGKVYGTLSPPISQVTLGPGVVVGPGVNLGDIVGTFIDLNVIAGQHYYYQVTSVSAAGVESGPSNCVSATIPTP